MKFKPAILFIPASIRSHIIPAFYLAGLLRDRYEVCFAVTDAVLRELVEAQGYRAEMVSGIKAGLGMEGSLLLQKGERPTRPRLMRAILQNEVYHYRRQELRALLEKIGPVAVWIDIFSSSDLIPLYADYRRLPLLFINPMLSTYRVPGYPAVMDGQWPSGEDEKPTNTSLKPTWKDYLRNPFGMLLKKLYDRQFKQLMQISGLDKAHPLAKDRTHALLFEEIPECIMGPVELEFSPEIRKPYQYYFGLSIVEDRRDTELDDTFREYLDILNQEKQKGKRLVYCTFGTFYQGADRPLLDFLNKLLDALEAIPGIQAVFSVNRFVAETLRYQRKLPAHIHLLTRVPQLEVLKLADLYVTHGGFGSIKESIFYGVPMLVYPLDLHYDQGGNALKVEHHKLGLMGAFHWERVEDMKRKMMELLENPVYKTTISAFRVNCLNRAEPTILSEQLALTMSEMKNVVGGLCLAQAAGASHPGFSTLAQAKAYAKEHGGYYCCASCDSASWVQHPRD